LPFASFLEKQEKQKTPQTIKNEALATLHHQSFETPVWSSIKAFFFL